MRLIARFRPSPALVVATLALLVALGGTGMAAVALVPKNSVGSAQVIDGSLQSSELAGGQVLAAARRSRARSTVRSRPRIRRSRRDTRDPASGRVRDLGAGSGRQRQSRRAVHADRPRDSERRGRHSRSSPGSEHRRDPDLADALDERRPRVRLGRGKRRPPVCRRIQAARRVRDIRIAAFRLRLLRRNGRIEAAGRSARRPRGPPQPDFAQRAASCEAARFRSAAANARPPIARRPA